MEEVDMENKAKRVSDKLTDSMYILANEPSVALFRLQEHVRKSLPELVEHKVDMQSREQQGQGLIYDVDYAIGAVNNISRSAATFSNVEGLLRKAVAIKQQLNKASSRTSLTFVMREQSYSELSTQALADTACNTGATLRPTF